MKGYLYISRKRKEQEGLSYSYTFKDISKVLETGIKKGDTLDIRGLPLLTVENIVVGKFMTWIDAV